MESVMSDKGFQSLVDVIRHQAECRGEKTALQFADGDGAALSLSYGELDRRARAIAAQLQQRTPLGSRALLLDRSAFNFVLSFFGCLYAGVIAVPIYAPGSKARNNARVAAVVTDSDPDIVLDRKSVV